ncbi:MAG: cobalt-precorrin 5A hydrolase [Hungatella sp.]
MRIAVISFTEQGNQINQLLIKRFREFGEDADGYLLNRFLNPYQEQAGIIPLQTSLGEWTRVQFAVSDGIIFVGAVGIAVRAIAPFVQDKLSDPAVVAVDEIGQFSISLLSGHMGGANDLALLAAKIVGAIPVITTATDLHGIFAVDVFAKKYNLVLSDRTAAKQISADLLSGIPVGFYSDFTVEGELPKGFTQKEICAVNLWITCKEQVEEDSLLYLFLTKESRVLKLIPKVLVIGIGCRKGTSKEAIQEYVEAVLKASHLMPEAVAHIASIDLKKDEPGLIQYADACKIPFLVYSAEELRAVVGSYTDSAFVEETTGVGNVCERAAMCGLGAEGGQLLVKKQSQGGVTVAVAQKRWKVQL